MWRDARVVFPFRPAMTLKPNVFLVTWNLLIRIGLLPLTDSITFLKSDHNNAQYELESICFCKQEDLISIDTGNRIFFFLFFLKCGFPFLFFLKSSHPGLFFCQVFILQELGRPCHSITSFSRKFPFRFFFFFRIVRLLSQFVCVWKTWLSPTGRRGKQSKSPKWQSTQNFSRQLYIVRYYTHFRYCVYSLPPSQAIPCSLVGYRLVNAK